MSLEADVVQAFAARGATLALAESVTGGLVAARLTDVPGASRVLLGSVVTYSDEAKRRLLGVDAATLAAHGAASLPVAERMAAGARRVLDADVAVSATGAAGPDPLPEAPVGAVFLGVATRAGARAESRRFVGPRARVRAAAADAALTLALAALDAD